MYTTKLNKPGQNKILQGFLNIGIGEAGIVIQSCNPYHAGSECHSMGLR